MIFEGTKKLNFFWSRVDTSRTEEAKKEAEYITTPVMEDGIWNGCKYFNLI